MTPFFICMHGLSGSGKTTAANVLSAHFTAHVYHSDVERKNLFGLSPDSNSSEISEEIYTKSATLKTFQRLYDLANIALIQKQSVILDAAFLKLSERQKMHALATSHEAPFLIVNCLATEESLVNRIKKRRAIGNDASEAKESIIAHQQRWQEAINEEEKQHTVSAFTENTGWQEALVQQISQSLQQW